MFLLNEQLISIYKDYNTGEVVLQFLPENLNFYDY